MRIAISLHPGAHDEGESEDAQQEDFLTDEFHGVGLGS